MALGQWANPRAFLWRDARRVELVDRALRAQDTQGGVARPDELACQIDQALQDLRRRLRRGDGQRGLVQRLELRPQPALRLVASRELGVLPGQGVQPGG